MDLKALYALRQELAETQVVALRKRSEVSNLLVGYRRSEEGASPIPAGPLQRNLSAVREELSHIEKRLASLERQLAAMESEGA